MASKKSSILKPRKVREPLQDLNQLLPNNDEEETTTTDVQRRKVSFASMNKVKEFEAAAECVTLLNTPAYEERFSISSDSYQSSVCGRTHTESTYQVNVVSNISRKSILTTFESVPPKQSMNIENTDMDEDIELTEANGRIYDIPMKSSGDSSMEMTNLLSQSQMSCLINCEEIEEVLCPVNEKADSDTSSMETTEVISAQLIRSERSDIDTSSMETTDVIYDNVLTESIKGQSMFYETGQFDDENGDTENLCEEIEYVHVRNSIAPQNELIPPRKSIFEMDGRKSLAPGSWATGRKSIFERDNILSQKDISNLHPSKQYESMEMSSLEITNDRETGEIDKTNNQNNSVPKNSSVILKLSEGCKNSLSQNIDKTKYSITNQQIRQESDNKTKYNNSSMQLMSQEIDNKTNYNNSSMQLMSQDIDNKTKLNSTMQLLSQEVDNKTNYCNLSMQLQSQEADKTKYFNLSLPLLSQEEKKTRYSNPGMHLLSQETGNKTKYNNSSLQLLSQETDENKNNNSSVELSKTADDKTKLDNSSMHFTEALQPGILKEDFSHVKHNNSSMLVLNKTRVDGTNLDNLSMHFVKALQPNIMKEDFLKTNQNISNIHQTKFDNSSAHLVEEKQALNKIVIDNSESVYSNMNLTETLQSDVIKENYPEKDDKLFIPPHEESAINFQSGTGEIMNAPVITAEVFEKEIRSVLKEECRVENGVHDVQEDIGQKSMVQDNSSASDSNSPLTVGVNFSIFQKNKETRVEFSGTIDSNKKKKSISNVQVNIINNKVEKQNVNVKELRFSMPATRISPDDGNKRPDFHATFTDCSVPSIEKKQKSLSKGDVNERVEEEVDAEKIIYSDLSNCDFLDTCHNENSDQISLSKPTRKRLSSEVLEDAEANKSLVKRRSITNDIQCVNKVETARTENIEYAEKRDHIIQQDIKEITQRRESFIREEKSMVSVNNVVVETCAKSTNMNISYEAKHILTSPDQLEEVIDLKSHNNENKKSVPLLDNEDKSQHGSPEIRNDNTANRSFMALHSTPYRKNQSMNQSHLEDEMTVNSLHNPSIIVNIGDSFSHYKSMDLGPDNFSTTDVRDSPEGELDVKNLIENIASDNICRENFVADWLENKTGRNVDSRVVERSNIMTASCQSIISVNQNNTENIRSEVNMDDNKINLKQAAKVNFSQCNTENEETPNGQPVTATVTSPIDSEFEKNPDALLENVCPEALESVASHSAGDLSVPCILNLSFAPLAQTKQLEPKSVAFDVKEKSHIVNAEEIELEEIRDTNVHAKTNPEEVKITKENKEINIEQIMITEKSEISQLSAIVSSPLCKPVELVEKEVQKIKAQPVEDEANRHSENISITSIENIKISVENNTIYNESCENESPNTTNIPVTDTEFRKNIEILTVQSGLPNAIYENNNAQPEVLDNIVTHTMIHPSTPFASNHSHLSSEVFNTKEKPFISLKEETQKADEFATAENPDINVHLKKTSENYITEEIVESVNELIKHVTLNAVETKSVAYQMKTSFDANVSLNNTKVLDNLSILPMKVCESFEHIMDHAEITKKDGTSSLQSADMDIEEVTVNETNVTSFNSEMSIEEKFEEVKIKNKNKSSEIIIRNEESAFEKRQKMSPEFNNCISKYSTVEPVKLSNAVDTLEKRSNCKSRKNQTKLQNYDFKYQRSQDENTRMNILEKIKKESYNNSGCWSIKMTTNDEWTFEFFFGHIELTVKFSGEEFRMNSCIPRLKYVHPAKFKEFEILKISVNSFIKKYDLQMNNVCRRVEDIPFLLDWVNKRINRLKRFVTDMMKLTDSEGLKVENGKASFYISSYRKHLFFKVEVNIKHFENLSIDDIKVVDKIGKADINQVRKVFTIVGQEMSRELNEEVAPIFFSFSKFVKNLWETFDPPKRKE